MRLLSNSGFILCMWNTNKNHDYCTYTCTQHTHDRYLAPQVPNQIHHFL